MATALILASASPRRRELLAQTGIPFTVDASDVPEIPTAGESAATFAQRVARAKAVAVAQRHPDAFVVGADTVVVLDATLFGKPLDRADARRMLRALSGRAHHVLTAVALVEPGAGVHEVVVDSIVEFRQLTATEIEAYCATAEPYDKAGAYALQGAAGGFVTTVRGSRTNVIGLPLEEVTELLRRHLPRELGAQPRA